MIELLAIVGITLSISFICSMLEACLLSVSHTDIAQISEKRPQIGNIWNYFKSNIHKPIAVILIANTLAHTIGASISGSIFTELYGPRWIAAFSIVFSFVMIQWTEITPKSLAVTFNRQLAVVIAKPLKALLLICTPVLALTSFLNRPFEKLSRKKSGIDALDDINILIRYAALKRMINRDQEKIISRAMKLPQMKARDIMIPGDEIKFLSTSLTLAEALVQAHLHHHTRLPLVDGTGIDDVIGYVNFKDIVSALQLNPKDPSLRGISRKITYCDENENIMVILNRLSKSYQHICIVRDAAGRIAGLVSLEDIIEAIVGEIYDEYDVLPSYLYPLTENRYIAGGGVAIQMLTEALGLGIEPGTMNVNEFVNDRLKKTPKAGDVVMQHNARIIIQKVRRSNVYEVIVDVSAIKDTRD